jgi:hypothetical protein
MTEVATPQPPANATEARAALDARISDKSWGERLMNGDITAKKEFHELTSKIDAGGDDVVAVAMSGKLPGMATTDQRHMAASVEMFRELGIRDEATSEFLRGQQVTAQEYELVSNWKKTSRSPDLF